MGETLQTTSQSNCICKALCINIFHITKRIKLYCKPDINTSKHHIHNLVRFFFLISIVSNYPIVMYLVFYMQNRMYLWLKTAKSINVSVKEGVFSGFRLVRSKELDPLTNVFGLPNMKIMNGAFEQISVVIISLQHIPVSHVKQFCSTGCWWYQTGFKTLPWFEIFRKNSQK